MQWHWIIGNYNDSYLAILFSLLLYNLLLHFLMDILVSLYINTNKVVSIHGSRGTATTGRMVSVWYLEAEAFYVRILCIVHMI
jgi:hypothetical protein